MAFTASAGSFTPDAFAFSSSWAGRVAPTITLAERASDLVLGKPLRAVRQ